MPCTRPILLLKIEMKKNKSQVATTSLENKNQNSNRILFFIIFLISFIVFANSIPNGYNLDDELVTKNHPLTSQGLKAIGEIFTSPYYKDDMGYTYGYRPIVHLSFAIEHQVFGENPQVSHFINVVLFALSVLLFLQLLLRIVGEEQKMIAVIAAIFFAVHPIHSEVVASIKNRDELLAFLFSMFAALFLLKYYEKGKWQSLIWVAILFSIGMLSKKSIFSMTIVLPSILILTKSISWKKLFYIYTALSLPSSIISSELSLSRFTLLSVVSAALIFGIYYFKLIVLSGKKSWKFILDDFNFWLISISMLLVFLLVNSYFFLIPVLYFLLFFSVFQKEEKGMYLLTIVSALIGLRFNHVEFVYYSLIVLTNSYIIGRINKEKVNFYFYPFYLFTLFVLVFLNPKIDLLPAIFSIVLFVWLYNKKVLFGLFFSFLILILAFLIGGSINNFGVLMLTFSLLTLLADFVRHQKIKKIASLFSIISIFFLPQIISHFDNNVSKKSENIGIKLNSKKTQKSALNTIFQEGRHLEYVENTLVEKHTFNETIGTGFSTIGEYSKLMIFPKELSFYYGFSKVKTVGLDNVLVMISFVFHLGLFFFAIWQLTKRPILAIGIGWYLLSILLFSNWFELVAGMVGERLAFTASAGFSLFLGCILIWVKPEFNFKKPKYLEGFVLVILLLFALKLIQRNSEWKNKLTLMSNDIKHLQNSAQANNLLAINYISNSNHLDTVNLAIKHFKNALTVYPDFFNVNFDLALTYMSINDTMNAIKYFERTIQLDPSFPEPFYKLVLVYDSKKDWDNYYRISKQLFKFNKDPNSFIIWARANLEKNRPLKAKIILKEGAKKYPDNKDITFCLKDLESKHW